MASFGMSRRLVVAVILLLVIGVVLVSVLAALYGRREPVSGPQAAQTGDDGSSKPQLRFSEQGTFKIMQLTDMHLGEAQETDWGPFQDVRTNRLLSALIPFENPDLIVLSGDQLAGNDCDANATTYYQEMAEFIESFGIPWLLIFGNHDDADLTRNVPSPVEAKTKRPELAASILGYPLSLTQIGPSNVTGTSNYAIPIYAPDGSDIVSSQVVLLDSGGGSIPEQLDTSQVEWFRDQMSMSSIPTVVFQHIPNSEFGFDQDRCVGTNGDGEVTPVETDSGMLNLMESDENVMLVAVGHNHGNDYCCLVGESSLHFCFGRHSGYGGYSRVSRGARVYELQLDQGSERRALEGLMKWNSWVRLEEGDIVDEYDPFNDEVTFAPTAADSPAPSMSPQESAETSAPSGSSGAPSSESPGTGVSQLGNPEPTSAPSAADTTARPTSSPPASEKPKLLFSEQGTFKIMQLTDMHVGEAQETLWGPFQDIRTFDLLENLIPYENPDLIILTGDVLTADDINANATTYLTQIAELIETFNIPWAVTFGNHDDSPLKRGVDAPVEAKTKRPALAKVLEPFPMSLTETGPDNVMGTSNFVLPIYSPAGDMIVAQLVSLDSGGGSIPEQLDTTQVEWFRQQLEASPIPSIVFQHIPTREFLYDETRCGGENGDGGFKPVETDNGMLDVMKSNDNVLVLAVGHNHGNDYCCPVSNSSLHYCFGRHSGYGGYSRVSRGSRLYELSLAQGNKTQVGWNSWVRLQFGDIIDEYDPVEYQR